MAANGIEGLEAMRGLVTDVVLLDQHMGPMDGLSFAKYVRLAPDSPARNVGLLMVTAQADRSMVAAAKAVGVDSFLAKPVSTAGLARSLERAMGAVEGRRAGRVQPSQVPESATASGPVPVPAAPRPAPASDDVYEL